MAKVKFLSGTFAEYNALPTKDDEAIYFIEGQIFKGSVPYTDQIVVVDSLPVTMTAGKIYINKTDKSITYFDGTSSTVVVPATVAAIGDSTPDDNLANVKAIKDFVAAEIAKIPEQIDYTVTLVNDTPVDGEKTKQILKQGKSGEEVEVGKIIIPDLVMSVKGTPNEGFLKTYEFKYGDKPAFEVDIPKDLVVTAGQLVVVDDSHPISGLTNGTYLQLTIANQSEPVYINVADLCDVYTGTVATNGITIEVSDTNAISGKIVGKAIAQENLVDELATKITDADDATTWGSLS